MAAFPPTEMTISTIPTWFGPETGSTSHPTATPSWPMPSFAWQTSQKPQNSFANRYDQSFPIRDIHIPQRFDIPERDSCRFDLQSPRGSPLKQLRQYLRE